MNTTLEQRIQAFVQLSKVMESLSLNQGWPGFDCGLTEEEYESAQEVIVSQVAYNGWFTEANTRRAIGEWSDNLTRSSLDAWLKNYPIQDQPIKEEVIAIICAGNIPMVGFHDILCVLLSGHKVMIKLSSDDARLIPLFYGPKGNCKTLTASLPLGAIIPRDTSMPISTNIPILYDTRAPASPS
jgi:hypothetical protein